MPRLHRLTGRLGITTQGVTVHSLYSLTHTTSTTMEMERTATLSTPTPLSWRLIPSATSTRSLCAKVFHISLDTGHEATGIEAQTRMAATWTLFSTTNKFSGIALAALITRIGVMSEAK